MLILILTHAFSISKSLKLLAELAKSNLNHPQYLGTEEVKNPGQYDLNNGISFYLTQKLVGPGVSGIRSIASNPQIHMIAVVQTERVVKENIAIVDDDGETIYHVNSFFSDYQDVSFYNVTQMNPLLLFSDLSLGNTENSGLKNHCQFNYNWNYSSNRPYWKDYIGPIGIRNSIGFRFDFDANTHFGITGSWFRKKFRADYSFQISGVIGFGLDVLQILVGEINLFKKDFPLYGTSVKFCGIKLGASTGLIAGIESKRILITLPKRFTMYKAFEFSIKKSGSFLSNINPFDFEHRFNIYGDNFNFIDAVSFENHQSMYDLQFHLDCGLYAEISLPCVKARASVGAQRLFAFTFSKNTGACPYPYLYGQLSTSIRGYILTPKVSLFHITIFKQVEWYTPYLMQISTPHFCLFSPFRSLEGSRGIGGSRPKQSYGLFLGAGSGTPGYVFYPKIIAYNENRNLEELSIDKIQFESKDQLIPLDKFFVFSNENETTVPSLLFDVMVEDVQTHIKQEMKIDQISIYEKEKICINDDLICFNIKKVINAYQIDIFTEFIGKDDCKFISFLPLVPSGSTFGLITHGVENQETYSTTLLDSNRYNEAGEKISTSEKIQNSLKFKIKSFKSNSQDFENVDILFDSCKDYICYQIGKISNIKSNGNFELVDDSVVYQPEDDDTSLIVSINPLNSKNSSYSKEFKGDIYKNNLNFTLSFDNNLPFSLEIEGENVIKNIIFELDNPINSSEAGIVCRVFSNKDTIYQKDPINLQIQMQDLEKYGILMFNIDPDRVDLKNKVGCIIKAKDILPLCDYIQLDEENFAILLENSKTLFNQNEIHIPFRRKDEDAINLSLELKLVFSTTSNMLCSFDCSSIKAYKGFVGCIGDFKSENNTIDELSLIGKTFKRANVGDIKTEHDIQIYEIPSDETIILGTDYNICPKTYKFPNEVTLQIKKQSISPFLLEDDSIQIKCDRCNSIEVIGCDSTNKITSNNGIFKFKPSCSSNYTLKAWCDSSEQAYCYFKESFENHGLALILFEDPDGFYDEDTDISERLGAGFSKQIVYRKNSSNYYKTWQGKLSLISKINKGNLTFTFNYDDDQIIISAKFGDLQIPFNANQLLVNFNKFIDLLGIGNFNNMENGEDILNFSDDGEIIIDKNYFDQTKFDKKYASYYTGIPESYIQEVNIVTTHTKKSLSKNQIIIICVSCVACLAVISVVSVLVVRKIRNQNDESIDDNI